MAVGAAAATAALAVLIAVLANGSNPTSSPTRPATAPAQPPRPTVSFGANVGRLFNERAYSSAEIGAQLAALRQTGATVARSDALWEATEPAAPSGGSHRYDWTFDDSIAASLAEHGLRWLPIIDYSAPWAQSVAGRDHSPPASTSAYVAYGEALARRYGPGGAFWTTHPGLTPQPVDTYEIWNEPDNSVFWSPTPNAAAYANLYLSTRTAIDSVQTNARVIIGGLTHPASFLPAMVAADPGLVRQVGGVGIHPYGATPSSVLDAVRKARLTLDSLGMGTVPLYITEFGWTTHPAGALDWAPSRDRPSYVARTLTQLGHANCGLADVLLYTWLTPERDPANAQDWFGISPPSGGSTADTVAFGQGLRAATSPGATIAPCG